MGPSGLLHVVRRISADRQVAGQISRRAARLEAGPPTKQGLGPWAWASRACVSSPYAKLTGKPGRGSRAGLIHACPLSPNRLCCPDGSLSQLLFTKHVLCDQVSNGDKINVVPVLMQCATKNLACNCRAFELPFIRCLPCANGFICLIVLILSTTL